MAGPEFPHIAAHTPVRIALWCDILGISINEANDTSLCYIGDVTVRDNVEHGIVFTDQWVATHDPSGPFRQRVFDRVYQLDIRNAKPFWDQEGKRFTISTAVDRDIRHHIVHAIIEVNNHLPFNEELTADPEIQDQ